MNLNERYKPSKYELYGFCGLINLLFSYLRTRIFYPKIKLVRFPVEIRGKKHIDFGKNLTLGKGLKIEAYPYINKGIIIKFGTSVGINDYAHITGISSIEVGNNVLMAGKIYISDGNHGSYDSDEYDSTPESIVGIRPMTAKPIKIGENVWLGENVAVLGGVNIGQNAIIGAHSVVTKDIPPNTIAVGNPAKPIKEFDLKKNKWVKITY